MKQYNFNISLSILNHLGRNLYRSFMTVLGEAISNSWDADAYNVYITIDRDSKILIVRDDGDGMNENDFQNKVAKAPVIILNPEKTLSVVSMTDITDELRAASKETLNDYKKLGKNWVDEYVYSR